MSLSLFLIYVCFCYFMLFTENSCQQILLDFFCPSIWLLSAENTIVWHCHFIEWEIISLFAGMRIYLFVFQAQQ